MRELAQVRIRYGYRRLHVLLRREGWSLGKDQTYRLCRFIWNRSQWVKDPDSGKRMYLLRPRADWVTHEMPQLRIVSDELWEAAKNRERAQSERIGAAVRRGISLQSARPPGGATKYLLSGLLVCGECGSKFVVVNRTSYGCSGHTNGRLCSNNLLVRRDVAETLLLAGIRDDLLTPCIEIEARRRIAKKLAERTKPNTESVRRIELQSEIINLADAIASGLLRSSPAFADRLARAERELARLQPASVTADPAQSRRCCHVSWTPSDLW